MHERSLRAVPAATQQDKQENGRTRKALRRSVLIFLQTIVPGAGGEGWDCQAADFHCGIKKWDNRRRESRLRGSFQYKKTRLVE